jgi:hypothetical protein
MARVNNHLDIECRDLKYIDTFVLKNSLVICIDPVNKVARAARVVYVKC